MAGYLYGGYTPIDGKEMSLEEGVRYYEKKVEDNPANPGYLIGYANTLRTAKRTEDAIPHYKNAIIYDPLAIEAYVSLGQIAENKGDHKSAYEYYSKAAGIIHTGNFYKLKQDIDQFKEALLDNLLSLQEKAGVKPAPRQDTGSIVKHSKVGRNAPCPCGSGRKYKKCCLHKETGQTPAPGTATSSVEVRLINRLIDYSKKERFKREFLNAMALYWRTTPVEPLVLPESASEDMGSFTEWYIIDYLLSSGKTIVDEFYSEMFSRLTGEEKAIIESHMVSYISPYEVQDVTGGVGLRIKDISTGREIEVREIKGSLSLVKWDIILARVYTLNRVNRLLGPAIQVIPRSFREGLTSFLDREFEKFRIETGRHEWSAFMKKRSYIIGHYLEDLPEEERVFLTEERDKVIMAKAHFDIRDFEDALDLFEDEYDFIIDDVVDGREAELTWLKRGKSRDLKESGEKHEKGVVVQSKLVHETGQLEWTVLGSVHISSRKMVLECLSRERLERGKKRLMEILRNLITHKADTFEDVERVMERARTKEERGEYPEPSEKGKLLMDTLLIRQLKEWPDKNIPALKGMTPREAAKTPEGRGKVMELIKDLENNEERKRKKGEPYLDIGVLKREFGLT